MHQFFCILLYSRWLWHTKRHDRLYKPLGPPQRRQYLEKRKQVRSISLSYKGWENGCQTCELASVFRRKTGVSGRTGSEDGVTINNNQSSSELSLQSSAWCSLCARGRLYKWRTGTSQRLQSCCRATEITLIIVIWNIEGCSYIFDNL